MKKNILFIMNNLNCGGAEKALISLLETLDYHLYNVDLLLFKHTGLFLGKIPKQVHLLDEPAEYKFFDMSIKKAIIECLRKGRIDIVLSRVCAGLIFRTEKAGGRCDQRVWTYISRSLKNVIRQYDAAIGYLEGNPIYFCIDNVKANKKIGFIHTDYDKQGWDPKIDTNYFNKLDHIVTVSEGCANVLRGKFPLCRNKIKVIYNIVSPEVIRKLSEEQCDLNHKGVKLVSVGRLNYAKGFDMAIDPCKRLVKSGCNIMWYIIGEGEERANLEKMMIENNLQKHFVLLGVKENPYPYIKEADVYVQPSRFEGKSIAIDEAKILCRPIIVTNFQTAKDQIRNEQNGLIVDMNPQALAEGIKRLIEERGLRDKLMKHLSNENLGTELEIKKLDQLLN